MMDMRRSRSCGWLPQGAVNSGKGSMRKKRAFSHCTLNLSGKVESGGMPGLRVSPRLLFEDGQPLTFGEFMDAILTLRGCP